MGLCTARSYSQRCKQQAVVAVMEEPGQASQKGICTSRRYYLEGRESAAPLCHRSGDDGKDTMINLHYAVTVAVARACRRVGVDARIKWPNDIWANGKKMAGILIDVVHSQEGSMSSEELCVMVGVGVNVHEDMHASTNASIATGATSVRSELEMHARQLKLGNKLE